MQVWPRPCIKSLSGWSLASSLLPVLQDCSQPHFLHTLDIGDGVQQHWLLSAPILNQAVFLFGALPMGSPLPELRRLTLFVGRGPTHLWDSAPVFVPSATLLQSPSHPSASLPTLCLRTACGLSCLPIHPCLAHFKVLFSDLSPTCTANSMLVCLRKPLRGFRTGSHFSLCFLSLTFLSPFSRCSLNFFVQCRNHSFFFNVDI